MPPGVHARPNPCAGRLHRSWGTVRGQPLLGVVRRIIIDGPVQRPQVLRGPAISAPSPRPPHPAPLAGPLFMTATVGVIGHICCGSDVVSHAVMCDLKEIDTTQQVGRAGEPVLKVPREVAEIDARTCRCAAGSLGSGRFRCDPPLAAWTTRRIDRLRTRERRRQDLTVGGDDDQLDAFQRQTVPGLTVRRRVPAIRRYHPIADGRRRLPSRCRRDRQRADLDASRQRPSPPAWSPWKVRHQHEIELLESGFLLDDVLDAAASRSLNPSNPASMRTDCPAA